MEKPEVTESGVSKHVEQACSVPEQESKTSKPTWPTLTDEAAHALNNQKSTKAMLLFSIWIAFAAWMVNFDLGYQGAVLIMPSYNRAFGRCAPVPHPATGATMELCSLSALQQSLISLQTLFYAVGAATAGPVGTWLGRRHTIQVPCALCIISAAGMSGTAGSFLDYMVCKCIGGVGIGQLQARHINIERSSLTTSSWTEIYGPENIRRTLTSALILIGIAITGIQFVGYYAALFLSGVGISNPYVINVTLGLCIFAGTFPGPFATEYLGRRLSMLIGYGAMASFMVIFSSVSTGLGPTNPTAKTVVVVFLCLWAFVFGALIGPCVWLASAEVHSVRLRTYGQASTTALYNIFAFGATFWTPYMLSPDYGNMGANVGYFYAAVTFVWLVLVFFLVPETAKLTLEQIDDLFEPGANARGKLLCPETRILSFQTSGRRASCGRRLPRSEMW
ncbi:hypothetical protein CLAIMM_09854 [Cladophialophora immunda]|nr:hypothetical protein CLAIMM_09854 [Cladophialophora immunda]